MFTYYHCYLPETWEGQLRAGLIDENAGIRFVHSSLKSDDEKFNIAAAVGSDFEKTVRELRLPMYVDRLQGGIYIEDYKFSPKLTDHYTELLGDGFKGFQMHEWMSNLANDIRRIRQCLDGEWTERSISEAILKRHKYPMVFLEAQTPAEHAASGDPKSFEEFLKIAIHMFKRRMEKCNNMLIPCDSFGLAYKTEIDLGAKMLMPEVGAQTPDTRLQIAYARGMARTSKDVSFGIYYEPWGGKPFSACCYQRDQMNEWGLGKSSDFPFVTAGENGGSSRSLQKRIHIYSYFAGAEFISEEWGMCNTFYDWRDFELSPYGKVKYDFLQLVKKYPKSKIGSIYTPIAIALPRDLPVLSEIREPKNNGIFGYALNGSMSETVKNVRRGIKALISEPCEMVGCETSALINSNIPDAIDVVHGDSPDYRDYEYFVDLTYDPEFKRNHRCCCIEDVPRLLAELLPCRVEGGVHWFVNRTRGGWLLVMINNNGVMRSVERGEYTLPEGDRHIKIWLKDNGALHVLEGGDGIMHCEDGSYELTVCSGEWFLAEF